MGLISPLMGLTSPLMGLISPLMGLISPLMGLMSPFMGLVSPLMGLMSPLMGGISPFMGGVSRPPLGRGPCPRAPGSWPTSAAWPAGCPEARLGGTGLKDSAVEEKTVVSFPRCLSV